VTTTPHGPGLGEPNPVRVDGRFRITLHAEVESSWQNAKMNHPAAIWSPRDGMWYDHHGSGGGAGKPPPLSQAAKALAQRLEEIKNLPIDDVQKQQQTQRALRDYADQLAAPPP
jgi:hypothetical protein